MSNPVADQALDQIFRAGRSHNAWHDTPVSDAELTALYDLMKMAPTSANCSPARVVFVRSAEAKAKLLPLMLESNRSKVEQAPVVALIAYHKKFYDFIPQLFPHNPGAREWFAHSEDLAQETAFRNSSLQGGYFMLAARAIGLDVGPMSGFDAGGVNAAFFPDGECAVNFICCLGHGDEAGLFARSPRLDFADACQII
jgi:3-hydroxypropanoate dehydrogenase